MEKRERERGGNVHICLHRLHKSKRLEHAIITESKDKILRQPPTKSRLLSKYFVVMKFFGPSF